MAKIRSKKAPKIKKVKVQKPVVTLGKASKEQAPINQAENLDFYRETIKKPVEHPPVGLPKWSPEMLTIMSDTIDVNYNYDEEQKKRLEAEASEESKYTYIQNISQRNTYNLLNALRAGFGLSLACQITHNDIQIISSIIRTWPNFKAQCILAVQEPALKFSTTFITLIDKHDLDEAKAVQNSAQLLPGLNLWADFCTKDAFNPQILLKALVMLKHPKEAATVCSLTQEEYIDFILANPEFRDRVAKFINMQLV